MRPCNLVSAQSFPFLSPFPESFPGMFSPGSCSTRWYNWVFFLTVLVVCVGFVCLFCSVLIRVGVFSLVWHSLNIPWRSPPRKVARISPSSGEKHGESNHQITLMHTGLIYTLDTNSGFFFRRWDIHCNKISKVPGVEAADLFARLGSKQHCWCSHYIEHLHFCLIYLTYLLLRCAEWLAQPMPRSLFYFNTEVAPMCCFHFHLEVQLCCWGWTYRCKYRWAFFCFTGSKASQEQVLPAPAICLLVKF